jgi:hypothetical protein
MRFVRVCAGAVSVCAALWLAGAGSALAAGRPHSLSFVTPPHDAVVAHDITGVAIDPSGPPVTVALLERDGKLRTASSAPVTISLGTHPAGARLGGTTTVDAVRGVATFSNLTIDRPAGGYTLVASSSRSRSAASGRFDEFSAATVCPPNSPCQTTVTTASSVLAIAANPTSGTSGAGVLSASLDIGSRLQCQAYTPQDPNWFSFSASSSHRTVLLTYAITPAGPETELVGNTKFCLGAASGFTTISGTPAPAGRLPNGSSGFIGLLPSCHAVPGGPCVDSRRTKPDAASPTGFDIVLRVVIPAELAGDPWGGA